MNEELMGKLEFHAQYSEERRRVPLATQRAFTKYDLNPAESLINGSVEECCL
jgi:hypothetical protein